MENTKFIGIDPDSKKFVMSYIDLQNDKKNQTKTFFNTSKSVSEFVSWVKEESIVVGIEGMNGQSSTLEKELEKNEIIFYSIPAYRIDKFRQAFIGDNKNNENDALATTRFIISLYQKNKLQEFKYKKIENDELRVLTRNYQKTNKLETIEINNLWKTLNQVSSDLYLLLRGEHPDIESNKMLEKVGILNLLGSKSNIYDWKSMNHDEFFKEMGNRNFKGREELIKKLMNVSQTLKPISKSIEITIRQGIENIKRFKEHKIVIEKEIEEISKNNFEIQELSKDKGIGVLTASKIISEIGDINRFKNDDNLASYAGLSVKENSTGDNSKIKKNIHFNRRLKDAFMQAAILTIMFNKDKHLFSYYKSLLQRGMKKVEAQKRVARAILRDYFKRLKKLKIDGENKSE